MNCRINMTVLILRAPERGRAAAGLKNVEPRAIDNERFAVDEPRLVGREETDRRGDVLGLADRAFDLLAAALDVGVVPEHRRIDRAGGDAIDANLLRLALQRQAARERFHPALAGNVR